MIIEINYNPKQAQQLLDKVQQLRGFEEVKEWDKLAQVEVDNIGKELISIDNYISTLKSKLQDAKNEHSSKSFIAKLISKDKNSEHIAKNIKILEETKTKLEFIKDRFEYWITATPDDEKEAKLMLAELKNAKKELGIKKKEVRANIKEINSNARDRNANISNQIFFTSPKLRRMQRNDVRSEKLNSLAPHEQIISEIDSKCVEIDKMIVWIERIKF